MKNRLFDLVKLLIGLALLYYLYTLIENPARLWQQIRSANLLLLLLGALCYAGAVALGGIKWGILLRAAGIRIPYSRLLEHQWVAEFFNNFLPGQMGGDVIRGYGLATDTKRGADAAASVLIDRFIGLGVFMLAAAVASTFMLLGGRTPDGTPFTAEQLAYVRLITLGTVGITLALTVMIAAILSRRLKQLVEWLFARLPLSGKTVPLWHKLAEAFNVYRHQPRALLVTAFCSLLIVVLTSINIWLISEALVQDSISLIGVLTINPLIVFLALIPLSPGGLGLRQSAFAVLYELLGASFQLGFGVGLIQQVIGYIVSIPGGLLWMLGRQRGAAPPSPSVSTESYAKPQL